MSKLVFERAHSLGLDEARSVAHRLADEMREKYDFSNQWEGDVLHFNRTGVRGTLEVTAANVRLDARLGVLLAAFAPRIQAKLDQNFGRYFG